MESIVFLHGLFGRPADFDRVRRLLPESFRTLAPELPIASGPGTVDSVDELVDVVAETLEAAGADRSVLVGNSLGGHVAIRLALFAPNRVSGLVLCGSSGLFERGFETGVPRHPDRAWVEEKIQEVFHDLSFATDHLIDETHETLLDRRRYVSLVRLAKSAKQENLAPVLPLLRVPTLLLWGDDDRITPPSTAREFQRLVPRSRLLFLSGCGHAPMIENPKAFAFHLSAFLRDLAPGRLGNQNEQGERAA